MYRLFYKRIFDLIIATFLLVLLLPVFLILMIFIRVLLGKPILFKQLRPGLHEEPFVLYKFRTMKEIKDDRGNLINDQNRLTRFGRLLRSTSLDELPELINVIKGDMSLVGPRPLLIDYLPFYNDQQRARHKIRPGITGWAQVNGRNAISWQKKFELDIWYVKNCRFLLDLKILFLTVYKIVKRQDINLNENVTMTRFDEETKKYLHFFEK